MIFGIALKKSLFLLFFPFYLFGTLNGNGDFQVWNTESTQIPLSPRTSFLGEVQFRYGDNGKKLYNKHVEGLLYFSAGSRIMMGPGYRQISHRINHKWVKEHDPIFDIVFTLLKTQSWTVTDRNRFQYRILPKELGSKSRLLYRNRLTFTTPYQTGRYFFNPYISDEIFWQEGRGLFENRARFGCYIPYRQRVFLDLNYIYRSLKNLQGVWLKQNILGVHLHFLF